MTTASSCGCCGGTTAETPAVKFNRPGLPAIAYRTGTYGEFRASLLARLSSTDYPALAGLTTRRDDDWTIALCDACAVLGDVLTFYQERVANESYLRTATERRSVLELARLIGYQLAPGVAASTAFAFTLESSPGQPALAAQPVTIPAGTRIQSIPDPDQDPQNFETVEPISARVEWNAMPVRTTETLPIQQGLTELYVTGTDNQIQKGDAILIVGSERETDVNSDRWDVRWLDHVETDSAHNLTHLVWSKPLGSQSFPSPPTGESVHVYVFRQRAALFGNNAPDANLIKNDNNSGLFDGNVPNAQWKNFTIDTTGKKIDLDSTYPKIVKNSWVALAGGSGGIPPIGYVELYGVDAVTQTPRNGFGLATKVTRVQSDSTENLGLFSLRDTQVLAQSEVLSPAARPLLYPLFGKTIRLGSREPDLVPGQLLSVSGKRQRVAFGTDVKGIVFPSNPGRRPPQAGESFILLAAPQKIVGGGAQTLMPSDLDPAPPPGTPAVTGTLAWTLQDHDGTTLAVTAPAGTVILQLASQDDDTVSETGAIVAGTEGVISDTDATTLTLDRNLAYCYDRATVTVNANVARATHGESVNEIGGSGDAGANNQSFQLKQSPLTYVSDPTNPDGRASTLEATVNAVTWSEVPTLYGSGPLDRVYAMRQDDDGKTTIQFGDGTQGARLPSGQNNVRFGYRKGIGAAGNLRTGQLTTLLTRPLGVKSATNPSPSTGGQDAEALDDARSNAPLRVLTLDRAVSIEDYADFARAFAGISKAYAIWIPDLRGRGVHLTVAGTGGEIFPADSDTVNNLIAALRNFGDALLPLDVKSYVAATFSLKAALKVAGDHDPDVMSAAVTDALRSAYSFDARDFGQPVTLDEVYATIQNVDGIVAVDIAQLYRHDTGPTGAQPAPRLFAALPTVQADGSVNASELLTLDTGAIALGVMS